MGQCWCRVLLGEGPMLVLWVSFGGMVLERLCRKVRPRVFFMKKEAPVAHTTEEAGRYQGWPQAGPPTLPSPMRKMMWLWATERKSSWVGAGGVIPGRKLAPQESARGTL